MKACQQDRCKVAIKDEYIYCTDHYYKLPHGEMPDECPEPSQLDRIEQKIKWLVTGIVLVFMLVVALPIIWIA